MAFEDVGAAQGQYGPSINAFEGFGERHPELDLFLNPLEGIRHPLQMTVAAHIIRGLGADKLWSNLATHGYRFPGLMSWGAPGEFILKGAGALAGRITAPARFGIKLSMASTSAGQKFIAGLNTWKASEAGKSFIGLGGQIKGVARKTFFGYKAGEMGIGALTAMNSSELVGLGNTITNLTKGMAAGQHFGTASMAIFGKGTKINLSSGRFIGMHSVLSFSREGKLGYGSPTQVGPTTRTIGGKKAMQPGKGGAGKAGRPAVPGMQYRGFSTAADLSQYTDKAMRGLTNANKAANEFLAVEIKKLKFFSGQKSEVNLAYAATRKFQSIAGAEGMGILQSSLGGGKAGLDTFASGVASNVSRGALLAKVGSFMEGVSIATTGAFVAGILGDLTYSAASTAFRAADALAKSVPQMEFGGAFAGSQTGQAKTERQYAMSVIQRTRSDSLRTIGNEAGILHIGY